MRIGVLGGTFDPIHLGHLIIAEEARDRLDLEEVCFVPARDPWMKAGQPLTSGHDRLSMARLAMEDNPFFRVSTLELERPGPSYTVDTLRELQEDYGPEAQLFFILGSDAFVRFDEWKDPEGILGLATLVVVDRPGATASTEAIDQQVGNAGSVERVRGVHLEISAKDIRRRVAAGASIRYLVPEPVERYIYARGLYRG
jgi:nicotinate-nucleotide adenylyltransferase